MGWIVELLDGGLPSIWPYILMGVTALLGAFGIYRKGRKDQKAAKDRDDLKAHAEMNDAETGAGMSDDERREWLRKFGRRNGN